MRILVRSPLCQLACLVGASLFKGFNTTPNTPKQGVLSTSDDPIYA